MTFPIDKQALALRRRLAEESGLGLVEILVAAVILVTGMLATFQLFDTANHNRFRTEQRQVALNRAQQEMERLRKLPYSELALTSAPASSSDPDDPRFRVEGTDFQLEKGGSTYATLVYNGGARYGGGTISGGTVAPGPQPFTAGDVSGKIHRFVVWRDDTNCTSVCPGTQDLKRVIVAVTIDEKTQTGQRAYVESHSDFIDPDDSSVSDLPPGPTGTVTAQQFYLTDTACESDGSTARVAATGDHALHNTLGVCSDGPQTGTTAGAPDALLTTSPGGVAGDPTYDFGSDAILEPDPNTDKGLQLLRQDDNGCDYTPDGTNPQAKIHRWVSDPFSSAFSMAGTATLVIYTQTINDAQMPGKICVYLFNRSAGVDTRMVNAADANPYFTWSPGAGTNWPSASIDGWRAIRINMVFSATTVASTQRLGVGVSLERAGSATDGFQFLYDHVDFQSRLEIDTTTPLVG